MHFSRLSSALALASAGQVALAQFVAPPTNLIKKTGYADVQVRYKEVPAGICEQDPNVRSYAGYADVAENQHIFWWFFETRNGNASEAPLTTWINGGPGSSSMIGLFQELGPCFINDDGKPYNNPYSFSNVSNMLFIDQPTQVGMSYSIPIPGYTDPSSGYIVELPSNHCPEYAADWGCGTYSKPNETLTASATPDGAHNFWLTLQGFMGAFPQYSRNKYYFTTESYGGHYGPIYNEYFETQNAKHIDGAHNISLAGVLIGNGWYDPLIQYAAYYNFTVNPGNSYFGTSMFNQSVKNQMYNNMYGPGNCYDQLVDCANRGINEICSAADNFCYAEVENIYDIYLGRDEYDSRELGVEEGEDPFPYAFSDYVNSEKVQQAIGAYVNFSDSSSTVGTAFGTTGDDGRTLTTITDMQKLVAANITVIMYTGDADYNCNWLGGQQVAKMINAPGFSSAGFVNITTSDGIVHGQVKQSANYAFVRIYESGHEVPFYQPVVALEMLERALNGLDIATGKTKVGSSYKTKGTEFSTYHEGLGTVQFKLVPAGTYYNTTTNEPELGVMNTGNHTTHVRTKRGRAYEFTL